MKPTSALSRATRAMSPNFCKPTFANPRTELPYLPGRAAGGRPHGETGTQFCSMSGSSPCWQLDSFASFSSQTSWAFCFWPESLGPPLAQVPFSCPHTVLGPETVVPSVGWGRDCFTLLPAGEPGREGCVRAVCVCVLGKSRQPPGRSQRESRLRRKCAWASAHTPTFISLSGTRGVCTMDP